MQVSRMLLPFALAVLSAPLPAASLLLYAGTYTNGTSKGIYVWRFDDETGKMTPLGLAAAMKNPSFVAIHPNRRFLYAVSESDNKVASFIIDAKTGKLTPINEVSTKGGGPCYVSLDSSGRTALVANYGGGSIASFPVGTDGRLGEAVSFVQDSGAGGDPKRQNGPHAHSIQSSPDNRFVLATDLGTDKVMLYKLDAAQAKLTPNDPPSISTEPGAGPRHFAFSPDHKMVYVINELNSTVAAYRYDAKRGTLEAAQAVSTLPADFKGENTTAEILVHPSGKFVYGSNRGHDSIAVFTVAADGKLTLTQNVPTQGAMPRNFRIDPSGKFLIAANQKGPALIEFRIDQNSGQLTATGETSPVDAAVCLKFLGGKGK